MYRDTTYPDIMLTVLSCAVALELPISPTACLFSVCTDMLTRLHIERYMRIGAQAQAL